MKRLKKVKDMIFKNKRWIILAIAICIFILIAKTVLQKELFGFDTSIYQFLVSCRTPILNIFFRIVTQFGSAIWLITITILAMIFIKKKKYKITIPLNLGLIALCNVILKYSFNRPRPEELRIIEETGFSFPSGHSMASMAFYGYLIYIIYKHIENKKLKYSLCILLGLMIFLIGLSRIYLGVHYTSDVIAGLCFSIAYLIFMISSGIYK